MNPVPDAARRLLERLREGLPTPFHPGHPAPAARLSRPLPSA